MLKRNVFLTYHHDDQAEVEDFIDSDNTDYVLRQLREKYTTGTSATIALIGQCTWARKYVNWEVAATLRNNQNDPRGGLLAVQLPSIDGRNDITLPPRVTKNRDYD